MNCTVYSTQIFLVICTIGSLTPPSNIRDLWIDVLGRELAKETVSKNSYLPTFQQNKWPNSKSPNYDKLHKVRTATDCLNKKLCQIRSVTELPQTNTFVQHMSDIKLKYTRRISLTSLAINFCVVL